MATFKAEVQNRRADGTYNVRIRVTHNRAIRRMSTNIFVTGKDLTKGLKIKNSQILTKCEDLVQKCRDTCTDLGYAVTVMPIDELVCRLKEALIGERFKLDFLEYMRSKAAEMKPSTGMTYRNAANALQRYLNRNTLDIADITAAFLRDFEAFLEKEPSQRGINRKTDTPKLPPKGGRAVSSYLACIRAIHNTAKREFNDEDRGIIRIKFSPFKNYKVRPQPVTRKRAISVEAIQKIIDLPYTDNTRRNLAKDCFILSFALVGMNSADMFYANRAAAGILTYNRRKTAGRRNDKAEMRVRLEPCLDRLLDKYSDPERLFNFCKRYTDHTTFNRSLNIGLKLIGNEIGIDDLEFYAARHSWATIARSAAVGIDKATVHEALNHVDGEMKVTDIYIDRDWSVIWKANAAVLALFDWTAIGWDVL